MAKRPVEETLIGIEENQATLRDCIEQAKGLAERSERLIRRNRDKPAEPEPPNPAS